VLFNDRPEIATDFTRSAEGIETEISKAKPDGTTALHDAVYLGVRIMKNVQNKRRVLLLVSDGGDNHSRYTARKVLAALAESDLPTYALGTFDDASRTLAERSGPDLLATKPTSRVEKSFPSMIYTGSEMRRQNSPSNCAINI
jgi:Ca-activated chloride channel homolog